MSLEKKIQIIGKDEKGSPKPMASKSRKKMAEFFISSEAKCVDFVPYCGIMITVTSPRMSQMKEPNPGVTDSSTCIFGEGSVVENKVFEMGGCWGRL